MDLYSVLSMHTKKPESETETELKSFKYDLEDSLHRIAVWLTVEHYEKEPCPICRKKVIFSHFEHLRDKNTDYDRLVINYICIKGHTRAMWF